MPHKVSFKAVTTGKDTLEKVSNRKSKEVSGESSEVPSSAHAPKKPRKASKKPTLDIPDHFSSLGVMVSGHPSPPPVSASGVVAVLAVKGDMEGIMGHPTPSSIHDAFSHFHLKSMEYARGLFLRWSECEESRDASEAEKISLEKRMSESDLSSKNESELAVFKSSLEEAAVQIKELQSQNRDTRKLLAGSLEELRSRPPPEVVVANFKESQNYKDILVDDTVSIMRAYSLKISEEFDVVHSMFPKFVEEHFGKEYVIALIDSEESDHEPVDDESDDDLGED
ncbi:hypothetical protein LIER_10896 [Lithospermum erythrorhizon]|uniref:Uncharacterized protein n=1 Tax=Lithospermum erythrorhizon TaxID=34254 RepID=A0AAV3PKY1_LITER